LSVVAFGLPGQQVGGGDQAFGKAAVVAALHFDVDVFPLWGRCISCWLIHTRSREEFLPHPVDMFDQ
jgi:hypothetical protein